MVLLKRLLVVVVAGVFLASCVSLPTDSSWGDVSLIGDPPQILFSFNDRLVQIDPTDGSVLKLRDASGTIRVDDQGNARTWIVQSAGTPQHFYTRPVATDTNTLVAASYEEKLYQVDTAAARILNPDGVTLPGHVVANPLLTDKFLYVSLSDGGLLALDPTDITKPPAWTFSTISNKGIWSQPLLVDGTMYVSSMDHFLYSLDPTVIDPDKKTPKQNWSLDLEGAVPSTATYANGFLYVGSYGRKVFKISPDGNFVAQFTTSDWVWGAPAVVGDMVYVSDLGGNIYALKDNGSSLDQVWSRKVANGAIRMTPLVTGDTIIVGSRDHNVYWISRETGDEVFHREVKGEVLSDILLIEPTDKIPQAIIIVSTLDSSQLLVAFTLDKGVSLWAYTHS